MSAKEKIIKVLEVLLDEHFLGSDDIPFIDLPREELLKNTGVRPDELVRIFGHLVDIGILKQAIFIDGEDAVYEEEYDYDVNRILFNPDFRNKAKEFLKKESKAGNSILYLDGVGNFWHGDKNDYLYSMVENSKRFLILKYLVEHKGFQQTKEIASNLEISNTQSVRVEISKIKSNIKKYLEIDGDEIIESKKDSGYRINPQFKIILKK